MLLITKLHYYSAIVTSRSVANKKSVQLDVTFVILLAVGKAQVCHRFSVLMSYSSVNA